MPAVLVPNYTIYVPGFDLNKDYNIDFYADLNGNGSYNAPPADHAWRLTINSAAGDFVSNFSHNASFVDIQWPGATAVDGETNSPVDYALLQNYPNPFNPSTMITFTIQADLFVTLKVFNILGSEITTLVSGELDAGLHEVDFNASGLSSGVYLYKMQAGNIIETRKMILMR